MYGGRGPGSLVICRAREVWWELSKKGALSIPTRLHLYEEARSHGAEGLVIPTYCEGGSSLADE